MRVWILAKVAWELGQDLERDLTEVFTRLLSLVLKLFVFVLGTFAFYVSLVLREDQERHLHNRIQELSNSIQEKEKLSGSRIEAFFNSVAAAVSRAFDRVFGKKLFSIR